MEEGQNPCVPPHELPHAAPQRAAAPSLLMAGTARRRPPGGCFQAEGLGAAAIFLATRAACQPLSRQPAAATWSRCRPGPPLARRGPEVPQNVVRRCGCAGSEAAGLDCLRLSCVSALAFDSLIWCPGFILSGSPSTVMGIYTPSACSHINIKCILICELTPILGDTTMPSNYFRSSFLASQEIADRFFPTVFSQNVNKYMQIL